MCLRRGGTSDSFFTLPLPRAELHSSSPLGRILVDQLNVLETMTPMGFLDFRDYLFPVRLNGDCSYGDANNVPFHRGAPQREGCSANRLNRIICNSHNHFCHLAPGCCRLLVPNHPTQASGFQSAQFRLMENKLGLPKERRYNCFGSGASQCARSLACAVFCLCSSSFARVKYGGKSYCSYLAKAEAARVREAAEEVMSLMLICLYSVVLSIIDDWKPTFNIVLPESDSCTFLT